MRVWFSGKILASQAEVASSILVTRFELRNRSTLIAERVRNGASRINRLAGAPQAHNHIVHFSSASLRRFGGAIRKNESGTADVTSVSPAVFCGRIFFYLKEDVFHGLTSYCGRKDQSGLEPD